jgi:hypothetical protein
LVLARAARPAAGPAPPLYGRRAVAARSELMAASYGLVLARR